MRAGPRVTPVTSPPRLGAPAEGGDAGAQALVAGGWISNKSDNICGIDDLKKVSNPAQVDYPDLLAATPQMKRIKKDGIDPKSPQGKLLRQEASTLITKACETVRTAKGYCGIWKAISHSDHRKVPDATSAVKAELK